MAVDLNKATVLVRKAVESIDRCTVAAAVAVGATLIEVKGSFKKSESGSWTEWCELVGLDFSRRTADRWIEIYQWSQKNSIDGLSQMEILRRAQALKARPAAPGKVSRKPKSSESSVAQSVQQASLVNTVPSSSVASDPVVADATVGDSATPVLSGSVLASGVSAGAQADAVLENPEEDDCIADSVPAMSLADEFRALIGRGLSYRDIVFVLNQHDPDMWSAVVDSEYDRLSPAAENAPAAEQVVVAAPVISTIDDAVQAFDGLCSSLPEKRRSGFIAAVRKKTDPKGDVWVVTSGVPVKTYLPAVDVGAETVVMLKELKYRAAQFDKLSARVLTHRIKDREMTQCLIRELRMMAGRVETKCKFIESHKSLFQIPDSLDDEKFRALWERFVATVRERGGVVTEEWQDDRLDSLSRHPLDEAKKSVADALARGRTTLAWHDFRPGSPPGEKFNPKADAVSGIDATYKAALRLAGVR